MTDGGKYYILNEAAQPISTETAMNEQAKTAVCEEIIDIMRTRDEQEAAGIYGGTPGGLEHMGDVWRLLDGWRAALLKS